MRILAIYPGLNPVFDEVAHALPALVRNDCEVKVLTTRMSALKSSEHAADYEGFRGVGIHRLYKDAGELHANPRKQGLISEQLAEGFRPDLVFLNSLHSLPLGRTMARRFNVPSVLRLESSDPLTYIRRRYYAGVPALGKALGRASWPYLASRVSAMMTNDPVDLFKQARLARAGPVYFAAHCAQQPDGLTLAAKRNQGEMIYAGSLTRHKNCVAWLKTLPVIFEETPVERFTIIGRGAYINVVEALKKRFGKRIEHIPGVTRVEALRRMSAAWFAYSESETGWGFLCDAWSTCTPVLCPRSAFGVIPGWTGMVPRSTAALVNTVRRLYDDPLYYAALQEGGSLRYHSEHTAEVVASQYLQIFREVMGLPVAGTRFTAKGGRASLPGLAEVS
jgi:glycosyltransferase involved in cell wall biosynthesis